MRSRRCCAAFIYFGACVRCRTWQADRDCLHTYTATRCIPYWRCQHQGARIAEIEMCAPLRLYLRLPDFHRAAPRTIRPSAFAFLDVFAGWRCVAAKFHGIVRRVSWKAILYQKAGDPCGGEPVCGGLHILSK